MEKKMVVGPGRDREEEEVECQSVLAAVDSKNLCKRGRTPDLVSRMRRLNRVFISNLAPARRYIASTI